MEIELTSARIGVVARKLGYAKRQPYEYEDIGVAINRMRTEFAKTFCQIEKGVPAKCREYNLENIEGFI